MKKPFCISTDGLIRLNEDQLMNALLSHLLSIVESTEIADSQDNHCGFTEWATSQTPALSIGWDWELTESNGLSSLKRVSPPRSNIMIVNASNLDIGFVSTEKMIAKKVDSLFWENFIFEKIPRIKSTRTICQHFS